MQNRLNRPASRLYSQLLQGLLMPLALMAFLAAALPAGGQTVTTTFVDRGSGGQTGQWTSMAIVNGNPAVAYYNVSDQNLMFARNSAADGSGSWAIVTLDSTGNVGQYPSLAVVDGNPAISYYDGTNQDLKYVRATDASGTSWGTPVTLDSTGNVGQYPSLEVVDGNPAISYYDAANGDLKYVRATDASGTGWGTPVTLDSAGIVGQYPSLEVVDGNPAISYYDGTNQDLKYVRATDASGTSWGTPVTLDSTGNVGLYPSLVVVNGNPAISYYYNSTYDLKYVRATDASGTSWGTRQTIASTGFAGQYASLAVVNGNPAISYYDQSAADLKYVRATDASGTSWGTLQTIDSAGDVGLYTSLAVVNGNPAISYFDNSRGDLRYVRATDASGTSWSAGAAADSGFQSGQVGLYTSQAVVNGNPAIAYYDGTNQDLRYVRALDASGTSWGTPLTLDSTGSVGSNPSLAVVNGNPAISYYSTSNQDLKYVRATDASGTSWGTPQTIDSTNAMGMDTSLAVVNGNPAISYFDNTNFDLKYVRATDASGTSWGTPVTIDSTGYVGQYTSLAVVNGNPAISYYDATNQDLKYVRATDASGTGWGTPVTPDSTGNVGQYTSLEVVNGSPAISYYDGTNTDLKYVRATDASGTGWGTPQTLDSAGNVGQYASLAVINGNPAISYYDNTNADLKYVRATDASGTSWGTPQTLDSTGGVGLYPSLAVVNGNPAISYYDGTNQDLKWATIAPAAPAPTVTVINPTSGPTAGGTSVTITGTGFTGVTGVTIGGAAATSVVVVDATTITCTTPAGTAGTASVLVTTPSGTNGANTLFTYSTPAPEIAVSGNSVSIADGDATPSATDHTQFINTVVGASSTRLFTLQNTGTATLNLTGTPRVQVSGTHAADFVVFAQPAATLSAGGSVNVQIDFTPGGSGLRTATVSIASDDADESTFDFAIQGTGIIPAPTVTGVSPASGTTAGGTSVVITGTNFTGVTAVTFGGTNAASYTVNSATQITATTPPGTAGTASVLVTSSGGTNAANTLYTYITPSTITFSQESILLNTDDVKVLNTGTFVVANNVGDSPSAATVNGVTFGTDQGGFGPPGTWAAGGGDFSTAFTSGGGLDTILSPLLYTGNTNPATLTLSSLTPGDVYRLQLFIANEVNDTGVPQTLSLQGTTYTTSNHGGSAVVVTVSFTALTTTQEVIFLNAGQRCVLNAYSLFSTPSTSPEIAVFKGTTAGTALTDNGAAQDLGSVNVGSSGTAQTFTIQNTGTANLTGLAVTKAVTGHPGDFTVDTTGMSTTLAPSATTTFTVTFSPTSAGSRTAVLNIASNDSDENPFEVNVSGTGVASVVIDFESLLHNDPLEVNHGTTYAEDGFTVDAVSGNLQTSGTLHPWYSGSMAMWNNSNTGISRLSKVGGGAFDLTSIKLVEIYGGATTVTFTGTRADTSTVTQAFTLDGNAYVAETFTFPGSFTNLVKVEWSQISPFHQFDDITLNGGGSSSPEIAVESPVGTDLTDESLSALDFGTTDVGESLTRTFRIKNTGTAVLNLTGVTFSGTAALDYTSNLTTPTTVAAGSQVDFTVTFAPRGSRERNAIMRIASNDANENPFDVRLRGYGTADLDGQWAGSSPLMTLPSGQDFDVTGLNITTDLDFPPTPGTPYTFIEIVGAGNAIIGKFNDLPEGGVVAMARNGQIYYFQADYTAGTDGNDLVLTNFTPSAPPAWAWVKGPKARNGAGIHGTQGDLGATNNPGARQGAMQWRDPDGSLWLFGGYGYGSSVTRNPRYLNDLWKYDRSVGQWVWVTGAKTQNAVSVYAGLGDPTNTPGARHTGSTWMDDRGNLWLFGGLGATGRHNDLWQFTGGNWELEKGSLAVGQPGVYADGDPANLTPGARQGATAWFTPGGPIGPDAVSGTLWLFGGTTNGTTQFLNDLWRYDLGTGNWTLVSGSAAVNQNGVYGTQGSAGAGNVPGARRIASSWVGQDGSLWLFGGQGLGELATSGASVGDLNDLWRYNPVSGQWTWVRGSKGLNAAGSYGTKNVAAAGNEPPARGAGGAWSTVDGKFWLVGGMKNLNAGPVLNDVWIFDPVSGNWTWYLGSATPGAAGSYGTLGTAGAGNEPGARFTPSTWVTVNGNLWVFGGGGVDGFGNGGRLSDLWTYGIPAPAGAPALPDAEPFPAAMIVNNDPNVGDQSAGTMAYTPVSGQLGGSDPDGDRLLFSSSGVTATSQGTLTLNEDGSWSYTPAYGFTGTASFSFQAGDHYGGESPVRSLTITVSPNPLDADGDGIADAYELERWGSLALADGAGDADQDGQSNYFEFLAGTDPLDAGQVLSTAPSVAGEEVGGGRVRLGLNHVRPGVSYHLEVSGDLELWQRVGTFTFESAGSAEIEAPVSADGAPRFYRMNLEGTPSALLP